MAFVIISVPSFRSFSARLRYFNREFVIVSASFAHEFAVSRFPRRLSPLIVFA